MHTFNTEAMKLGLRGVTIVVASGDNGVSGADGLCNFYSGSDFSYWRDSSTPWTGLGYFPSFPATSPYGLIITYVVRIIYYI